MNTQHLLSLQAAATPHRFEHSGMLAVGESNEDDAIVFVEFLVDPGAPVDEQTAPRQSATSSYLAHQAQSSLSTSQQQQAMAMTCLSSAGGAAIFRRARGHDGHAESTPCCPQPPRASVSGMTHPAFMTPELFETLNGLEPLPKPLRRRRETTA